MVGYSRHALFVIPELADKDLCGIFGSFLPEPVRTKLFSFCKTKLPSFCKMGLLSDDKDTGTLLFPIEPDEESDEATTVCFSLPVPPPLLIPSTITCNN